jgi:hypothetical protein
MKLTIPLLLGPFIINQFGEIGISEHGRRARPVSTVLIAKQEAIKSIS